MIVSSIKHKFLILGFAVPLRSGCTTAAKFFADNDRKTITEYLAKSEQSEIEDSYKDIATLLKEASLDSHLLKKHKSRLNGKIS